MEKKLRSGFTTGSCAAAASKAAAWMLLTGEEKKSIRIFTPSGRAFDAEILDIQRGRDSVKCAVRKDGGDDPDVTTGALIYADVRLSESGDVRIDGGEGVGWVTRPGLDQPPGEAAINSVPRSMIKKEIDDVAEAYSYDGGFDVIISVPGGEEIASRTFNPRLGIEGGISIIGTSGIVEPMSEQAILDTIKVELRQKKAEGCSTAFVSPGNYGLDFMKEEYSVDLDRSVKCSNFIGLTVDMVRDLGFSGMLLTGHAGKLVKVAGGIMNTHSREADCRMEMIASAAAREGAPSELILSILDSLTTEEAFAKLRGSDRELADRTAAELMERIISSLRRRAGGALDIECIMYTKENGLIAASAGAVKMIKANRENWNG